jgi:hypothetical protein
MHTTKTREQIEVHQLKWSMWELLEDDQVFKLQYTHYYYNQEKI